MLQIIYSSSARAPFTPEALDALLAKARVRNDRNKVTGMLLYHSGFFLQVLEGPEAGLIEIFSSIQRDVRHTPSIQHRKYIDEREFQSWSMGFLDSAQFPEQPQETCEFLRSLPEFTATPTIAKRYLRSFQNGLLRAAASTASRAAVPLDPYPRLR
jgi:hypothetical protein